jgi:hypothetical protein
MEESMDTSSQDLERPLPPSLPIKSSSSVESSTVPSKKSGAAAASVDDQPFGGPSNVHGGPGSVLVSEIDLTSTINFSTPTSFSSGFDFQAGLHIVELLKSCDEEVKLLTLWKCIDICGMAREQEMRGNQLPVSVAWW